MKDELSRYISGFAGPPEKQLAAVKSHPQVIGLRGVLSRELEQAHTCVMDFGMGILAPQLKTYPTFEDHSSTNWGIDLELTSDRFRVANLHSV